MKVTHSGDWHISRNVEKRDESERCLRAMLGQAVIAPPDLFVFSGDLADELDGRIMLDSDAARCLMQLVIEFAEIAPIVVILGTRSHDRDTPEILAHLRTKHPVYVGRTVEQVALVQGLGGDRSFISVSALVRQDTALAFLTLCPSLDKSHLAAYSATSVAEGNLQYRELMHDLLAGLGLINDSLPEGVPRVFVGHNTVLGCEYSSGQLSVGQDLEYSVADLHQVHADGYMLGHIHKHQILSGNIVYSGSPGRLNFGEVEDKGFVEWVFDGRKLQSLTFQPLPARKFCFVDVKWSPEVEGVEHVEQALVAALPDAAGADVRFRFDVPEELRHLVDRAGIEQAFLGAGALRVKIEVQIIPKVRSRAAGISRLTTLPEKVKRWGESVEQPVPDSVLQLAGIIEGMSTEELLTYALKPEVAAEITSPDSSPGQTPLGATSVGLFAQDQTSLF